MSDKYSVSLGDIRRYLASKQPNETVGSTSSTSFCLVARAMDHKYEQGIFVVNGTHFSTVTANEPWHPLPDDVLEVVKQFDDMADEYTDISRKEVEEAIPQLKGE